MLIFLTDIGKNGEYMTDEMRMRCYGLVRGERRARVDSLKNQEAKARSLAAGILLNVATGIYEGVISGAGLDIGQAKQDTDICIRAYKAETDDVPYIVRHSLEFYLSLYDSKFDYELTSGVNGKPEFKQQGSPKIFFNLSHAGEFVVCAIGDKPVGIDIEGNRRISLKTAKRFFTEAEYQWVCGNMLTGSGAGKCQENYTQLEDTGGQQKRFFRIWTMKEAYSKLTGVGIASGVSQAEFLPKEDDKLRINFLHGACKTSGTRLFEYELEGYCIAVISYT
ncbi:MAG: 4'-phosphopantetheinyl transferase superfamily protein [Eubacteriales bacterium]|nr:4'-phosphopantetheinyl transferase superfamily protein [Eubacteriales bacterium]